MAPPVYGPVSHPFKKGWSSKVAGSSHDSSIPQTTRTKCHEHMQNSLKAEMQIRDVIIVGAGAAVLSAASACRKWDLDVLVIDEFPKPGRRLLGQLHQETNGEWWNGIKETNLLLDQTTALDTDIRCGISVHHVEKTEDRFDVYTSNGVFQAKNVLIATGAAESSAPIPGW